MNLKKVNNDFEIVELNEKEIYTINKNSEKISIYDNDLLEKILDNNFNKKYKELLYLCMSIIEDEESTDTDTELALLKIEDLKNYIINHYSKFINNHLLNKYLKMIMILEGKLNLPKKRGKSR